MNTRQAIGGTARGLGVAARLSATVLWRAFGLVLYSVLALLEPAVMFVLSCAAVILCGLCAFWGLLQLVHPSHFPFGVCIGLIALCGIAAAVYQAILYLLVPGTGDPSGSRRP